MIVVVFACGDHMRSDELECEEAVGHLLDCCPGLSFSEDYCTYDAHCSGRPPRLDEDQSRCIRAKSCDELRDAHACERAPDAGGGDEICR